MLLQAVVRLGPELHGLGSAAEQGLEWTWRSRILTLQAATGVVGGGAVRWDGPNAAGPRAGATGAVDAGPDWNG
jgi:hypothetical protein